MQCASGLPNPEFCPFAVLQQCHHQRMWGQVEEHLQDVGEFVQEQEERVIWQDLQDLVPRPL